MRLSGAAAMSAVAGGAPLLAGFEKRASEEYAASAPHIAHFAMCGFLRQPGCIEITMKLGGKTLAFCRRDIT